MPAERPLGYTVTLPDASVRGPPRSRPSTWNWTIRVGVPAPGATAATVAVIAICWPKTDDAGDAARLVVVSASRTVCDRDPLLVLKLPSTGVNVAVTVCAPVASAAVLLLVATPPLSTTGASKFAPSMMNWTDPSGTPAPGATAVTVAVKNT